MTQLKSSAHPEWPYTGTPNEWRGFAREYTTEEIKILKDRGQPAAVYQKQNFGPELT